MILPHSHVAFSRRREVSVDASGNSEVEARLPIPPPGREYVLLVLGTCRSGEALLPSDLATAMWQLLDRPHTAAPSARPLRRAGACGPRLPDPGVL